MIKKFIKSIFFTFLISITFTSCIKETKSETEFEQEKFTPENGGPGGNSGHCQCVAYVKRQLGITTSTANAKNWGLSTPDGYTPPGYTLVSGTPQQQDIVVITPEFGGVDQIYGHIGFVNTVSNINGSNFNINIISSNYNGISLFTSCNCNNVNTQHNVSVNSNNRSKIRFYRNTSQILNCPDFTTPPTPTRIISLSGNMSYGNVAIGTTPSKPLTITNNGNSTLSVSSISLPNGYTSDYNSGTIPAGSSTTANITFTPQNTVTNYNGTLTVNSNSTSGTNTIQLTGSGVSNPPPAPTFSPAIGTATGCSFGNIVGSGNCAGSTYLGNTIRLKVSGYNQSTNTINFVIEKCSGTFSNNGTAYIKEGNYCGIQRAQANYNIGASSINLSVTPQLAAGSYTYTAVIVSATTDKFYTLSIIVQY